MLRTNHNTSRRLPELFVIIALLLAIGVPAAAQSVSTDADNPTPMASNVVSGKSNGKAKTVYYSFVATGTDPGEIKVKVTANTDERSTNLRVNFLDDDGQKVMDEIYVIPNRDPATKVARHTFADRQKVIMRVTLPDDAQVKLLTYKIEVTGAVEFEQPAVDPAATPDATATPSADSGAATPAPDPTAVSSDATPTAEPVEQQTSATAEKKKTLKQKAKEEAKKKVKSTLQDLLKDDPF